MQVFQIKSLQEGTQHTLLHFTTPWMGRARLPAGFINHCAKIKLLTSSSEWAQQILLIFIQNRPSISLRQPEVSGITGTLENNRVLLNRTVLGFSFSSFTWMMSTPFIQYWCMAPCYGDKYKGTTPLMSWWRGPSGPTSQTRPQTTGLFSNVGKKLLLKD